MDETTKNFLEVFEQWTTNVPEPKPISFRLYYDDQGLPICYTMDDLPGNYIEVDRDTFVRSPTNLRIVDNQIIIVQPKKSVNRLAPNQEHGTCCHPTDVCVVVDSAEAHVRWGRKTYETS